MFHLKHFLKENEITFCVHLLIHQKFVSDLVCSCWPPTLEWNTSSIGDLLVAHSLTHNTHTHTLPFTEQMFGLSWRAWSSIKSIKTEVSLSAQNVYVIEHTHTHTHTLNHNKLFGKKIIEKMLVFFIKKYSGLLCELFIRTEWNWNGWLKYSKRDRQR